ncbi:MAG: hypothetical protein IJJ26_12040, partial [Victivallales bacterium]|nr:hypothetical protein [Victivallales bacterium]
AITDIPCYIIHLTGTHIDKQAVGGILEVIAKLSSQPLSRQPVMASSFHLSTSGYASVSLFALADGVLAVGRSFCNCP